MALLFENCADSTVQTRRIEATIVIFLLTTLTLITSATSQRYLGTILRQRRY